MGDHAAAVPAAATADPASAVAVAKRCGSRAHGRSGIHSGAHRTGGQEHNPARLWQENLRLPCMLTRRTVREKK